MSDNMMTVVMMGMFFAFSAFVFWMVVKDGD